MKQTKILLAGMLILTPVFSAQAVSQTTTGCEAKRQDIEQQINYARARNNDARIAGLQKALSELNANCTDTGLRTDREADVREKKQKVEARRHELAEVQASVRTDKVSKKQQKLTEAQAELDEAQSMLNK